MFLHIGDSRVIFLKELVGIFNMDLQGNPATAKFLSNAAAGNKEAQTLNESNSFVVTADRVFYSLISPLTLQHRVEKKQI